MVEHDLCVRLLDHIVRLLLAANSNTRVCYRFLRLRSALTELQAARAELRAKVSHDDLRVIVDVKKPAPKFVAVAASVRAVYTT